MINKNVFHSFKCVWLLVFIALIMAFPGHSVHAAQGKMSPNLGRLDHCGTLTGDETWTSASNVHVITCDVVVPNGVTLTISAGSILKVLGNTSLVVEGSLRVNGVSSSKVVFTSFKDDSVGGDTNGDGVSSSPGAGDWASILFRDSSNDTNSLINYVEIRYGGAKIDVGCCGNYYELGSPYLGGITLENASPTIQNTLFYKNQYHAIHAYSNSNPVLVGNIFTSNGVNGLSLEGWMDSSATWNGTNTAYYIMNDYGVGSGSTLTINPGVVVKFANGNALIVDGSLRALGTAANKVYFTSGHDDTLKGDTNNDGSSSAALPGNWNSILFRDSSNDTNSLINYAEIRYAGAYVDIGNYYDWYGLKYPTLGGDYPGKCLAHYSEHYH